MLCSPQPAEPLTSSPRPPEIASWSVSSRPPPLQVDFKRLLEERAQGAMDAEALLKLRDQLGDMTLRFDKVGACWHWQPYCSSVSQALSFQDDGFGTPSRPCFCYQ
jgi:hypothetical protein